MSVVLVALWLIKLKIFEDNLSIHKHQSLTRIAQTQTTSICNRIIMIMFNLP